MVKSNPDYKVVTAYPSIAKHAQSKSSSRSVTRDVGREMERSSASLILGESRLHMQMANQTKDADLTGTRTLEENERIPS